jgi:hypothetical protein
MQRQMNADELDEFYRRVGAAIWHVQYLEDVMVSFLAMKILGQKRSGGQSISGAEMDALLAQKRRLTLGPLIQSCIGQNIITPKLEPRFETFKTERHWLVHRSVVESGDDLYNDAARDAVFRRIFSIRDEAISLKKLIDADLESWLTAQRVDVEAAAKQGENVLRQLKGN